MRSPVTGETVEPFLRRRNADGSWDSICKCCFFTIPSGKEPSDLERVERTHSCSAYARMREVRRAKPLDGYFEDDRS